MKPEFTKYLSKDSIVVLEGKTKREVLSEIIKLVASRSSISELELETMVWQRERMITTGVGKGLALPHVRIDGFEKPLVMVGLCSQPVEDYSSLDEEPIRLIVFIAANDGDQEAYLKLLSSVSEAFKDPAKVEAVLACEGNIKQVFKLLVGS